MPSYSLSRCFDQPIAILLQRLEASRSKGECCLDTTVYPHTGPQMRMQFGCGTDRVLSRHPCRLCSRQRMYDDQWDA